MSTEAVFSIFLYFNNGSANEYGMLSHIVSGNDETKTNYLRAQVEDDHVVARRFHLLRNFTPDEWMSVLRQGDVLQFFEDGFEDLNAPANPIFCITSVVDGRPTIDRQIGPGPFRGDQVSMVEDRGSIPDYLVHYTHENGFRFTDLINDDYFKAIRLLFNAGLHVSCAKLLMSCVDTISFVEYGDVPANFTRWLDTYADLSSHQITSSELWEFRNSILHMTNIASRKVLLQKVSPIVPYVGEPDTLPQVGPNSPKPFNLYGLIATIATGIGNWAESYNSDRDKWLKFIERYDTTISDSRIVYYPYTADN